MSRYDVAIAHLLNLEGGHDNDPSDAGGETNRGITKDRISLWSRIPGSSYQPIAIADITVSIAKRIWFETLWQPQGYAHWIDSQLLANKVFQAAAVMGPRQAHREVQRAINSLRVEERLWLVIDGVVGPKTKAAFKETATEAEGFFDILIGAHMLGFFRIITNCPTPGSVEQYRKNQRFYLGWKKRALLN